MNLMSRMNFLRRAWRYRLRSERRGLEFLFSRDIHGKTVVDAGANQGIYSYWMSRLVGNQGQVVAFEPQPELVAHLEDLRQAFRLAPLQIVPQGLSAEDGRLTLHRPRDFWAGAYLADGRPQADGIDRITVTVTTLDGHFIRHTGRPVSFIKCDVEGHELSVFPGRDEASLRGTGPICSSSAIVPTSPSARCSPFSRTSPTRAIVSSTAGSPRWPNTGNSSPECTKRTWSTSCSCRGNGGWDQATASRPKPRTSECEARRC
jgi:FkbM family methyltransferase